MRAMESDLPLSALNELGRLLIESKPPRDWDGETIRFTGELARSLTASKLAGERD